MPLETQTEYKRRPIGHLRSKSDDASLYPVFLHQRAIDYRTNAELLHKEAERAYSMGHITESNKLLEEANQIALEANEYAEKLFKHNRGISQDLRRQSQIDAEKSALAFQKSVNREVGEPKNNCTPVKIIREITNDMFILLTDGKIFNTSGMLEPLKTDKGIIGGLLFGFDTLQTDEDRKEKLQECQISINDGLKPFIKILEDDLYDYFKETRPQSQSISRSKSLYRSTSTSVKSFLKSVTGDVFSKSGKTKTKTTYLAIIENIIAKLGYSSYFSIDWVDATTSKEVKENFMTFCNELMKDIKGIYDIIKTQTKCSDVLHFGALHFGQIKRTYRASIGGKSRKINNKPKRTSRKPKRKSRKNKNK
jgi:hypothetical protein